MTINITSAKYLYGEEGTKKNVEIIVDGKTWGVPMDNNNSDYKKILEWAAIEGNNITDPGA